MPTSRDFRGSRRVVAQTLLAGSKTASEVGQAVDKPTGSIFGVLRRMVGDGLVVADTEAPERGTRYSLPPGSRDVLRAMEREPVIPGQLTAGQRLVLIEQPASATSFQRVLGDESISGLVSWATETGGGWILAVDGATSYPVQRLRMALESAGATAREFAINEILSGVELRDRASWLLDDMERIG